MVSANYTFGGLETNIAGQVREFYKAGIEFFFAVGNQPQFHNIPSEVRAVYNNIPFDSHKKRRDHHIAAEDISKIVIANKIDLIHAHPFTSIIPSYLASKETKVPFVVTLHGPASIPIDNSLEHNELMLTALQQANLVLAVSREVQDIASKVGIRTELAPNLVHPQQAIITALPEQIQNWLLISRLDDIKWIGIYNFIKQLRTSSAAPITIAGDGPCRQILMDKLWDEGLKNTTFIGKTSKAQELMRQYDIIGGMGRVALEALMIGKPVCLIGYKGPVGLIMSDTQAKSYSYSNFSGRGYPVLSAQRLTAELKSHAGKTAQGAYDYVRDHRNEQKGWPEILTMINDLK